MENDKQDLGSWVDARMASLNAIGDWQPNAARALAALRRRRRVRRAGSIGAVAAALAAGLVLVTLSGPRACANPMECVNEADQAAAQKKAPALPADLIRNYKESGSPAAKVTCEIYSDYQCPSCAAAFATSVPQFVDEYVKTGKVKLIHRDYPLPQHPYARLAARYVNAAGELGFYDAAVDYIFKTQKVWETDGSVDAHMAKLLPLQAMQKVRLLVQNDRTLDETVAEDLAMGIKDKINQTPSMVIVAKGKRQVIVPIPNMGLLRSYLDDLLK
jgi:protein-disulfide isomerase